MVFACDPLLPTAFESLWPPTAFSYFTVNLGLELHNKVQNTPTAYEWSDTLRTLVVCESTEDLLLEPKKARLLIALARSVNRHRRVVLKSDLVGQDVIYAAKLAEADAQQAKAYGPFPLLEDEAALCGVTVEQAALIVRFRAAQSAQYLRESERNRRQFTSRIVLAQSDEELTKIESELSSYETQF